jgi:Histidine kinase
MPSCAFCHRRQARDASDRCDGWSPGGLADHPPRVPDRDLDAVWLGSRQAVILLTAAACLALAFAIAYLDARAQPALHAKTVEVAQLRASRGRLVDASDGARREIKRDLHDGVQPRLVALLLNVGMARRAGQFDQAPAVIDGRLPFRVEVSVSAERLPRRAEVTA